jgi:protein-S-isoprenylcysteine O-methyltransferase Ste14
LTISRILFILMWVNEASVIARATPEDRAKAIMPRFAPVTFLLLLVPMFFALDLPPWLGWTAVTLQAIGLAIELMGEFQLARAKAFSIGAQIPERMVTNGLYSFLENPIFAAFLLQFVGWALWMPLLFIPVVFLAEAARKMVAAERVELGTIRVAQRRLDSFLWS